ncbi:uncharacterized protein N7473_005741 [Penicillium subrubescens]|uniref:uncharacterized protein n=1 Tax=Penicillium subrubescens TaxID=1316194 RepID=UPI0025455B0E|nr:uncharacterized protein N7473_005741 [Penicillium subrubescens]KAJ5896342.1 hypothetical protein N7473_005741 [Penicillium subrubescens]
MLVEKVLEYLYTANYTLIPDKQEIVNSDGSENSSLDGKSASPRWKRPPNKRKRFSVKNVFHFFGMSARPKTTAPLHNRLFQSAVYFHLLVYAEADYFMIDELKVKAEAEFCKAFEKLLTIELVFKKEYEAQFTISKIIGELYSRRGSYSVLREMVLELMLNNMPGLRQTIFMAPTEGCLFLSLHPEFAADLCWGMIEKTFPSDMPIYYPTIMPEQFASWERQFKARTGLC